MRACLIGMASFLSVAVGLECAPFVALALVGLGLAAVWTRDADLARRLSPDGPDTFYRHPAEQASF